jgi:hypothetical protein
MEDRAEPKEEKTFQKEKRRVQEDSAKLSISIRLVRLNVVVYETNCISGPLQHPYGRADLFRQST